MTKQTNQAVVTKQEAEASEFFQELALYVAVGALATSLYLHSIVPLIIVGFALFAVLGFLNGLV